MSDHALDPTPAAPKVEFFGRVKELHRLREALRSTVELRRRRAILLRGAEGIGKSRLLNEFLETAEEHVNQVTVLSTSFRPDDGTRYCVFRRLLLERFGARPGATDDAYREALLQGCKHILRDEFLAEEAAHVIGHLVGLPWPESSHIAWFGGDDEWLQERAIALFVQIVHTDAVRMPIVMSIDDLHFASDESLRLLLRLARGLSDAPVLFLTATRPAFSETQKQMIDGLRAVGEALELFGLADRDCRRIIGSLFAPEEHLPEDFVRVCCEMALGNPLQLEQIVRLKLDRGALERRGAAWVFRNESHCPFTSHSMKEIETTKQAMVRTPSENPSMNAQNTVPPPSLTRSPPTAPPRITTILSSAQCALLATLCLLIMNAINELREVRSELREVRSELQDVEYGISQLRQAPVMRVDLVKMRGSDTWTLPVSSISWSGR